MRKNLFIFLTFIGLTACATMEARAECAPDAEAVDPTVTEQWLAEIGTMRDFCNNMLSRIDETYHNMTDGREFIPEHLEAVQDKYKKMRTEVTRFLNLLDGFEATIQSQTAEDFEALQTEYKTMCEHVYGGFKYNSPLVSFPYYLKSCTFSCNEGGCIIIDNDITIRNESKKLYYFYSKAFVDIYIDEFSWYQSGVSTYFSVIPDDGYRIASVNSDPNCSLLEDLSHHSPDFLVDTFIVEFAKIPDPCAKPTIKYSNGRLTFDSETEGVSFHYEIKDGDVKSGSASTVDLAVTYTVEVYASRDGYEDSEVATATLCWIDVEPQTEGVTEDTPTDVVNVKAQPVLIQQDGNVLTISGPPAGTPLAVYDLSGRLITSAKAVEGVTRVEAPAEEKVVIVKVGERSVKVAMK